MTLEEYKSISFRKGVAVKYFGELFSVIAVNFEEKLFALETNDSADPIWVRYESAELVK